MENGNNNNYNKRYNKQSFNNKPKEADITKQTQEFDKRIKQKQNELNKDLEQKENEISKKLEQKQNEMNKALDQKQEEFNNKMEQKKDEIIKGLYDNLDEQIKISISKKMKEEEKKIIGNKNRKIVVRDIIIVLLIALIGYLAYCLYDLDFYNIKTALTNKEIIDNAIHNNSNNEVTNNIIEDNTNKEEKQETKTSKYYIENYGYLLDNIQITGANELYIYKNAISKEQIPNNIKLQIAYKNLDNKKKKNENGTVSFKAEDLFETCKEIFGEDATINNEIFEYNNNKFLYYNDTYLGLLENKEQTKSNVIYKIEKAYEKDNELTFEVIAAKKQENKLVNILTEQIITENYNGEDILTYKDNMSKYNFIYSKIDDNYYFEKVEINDNGVEI